MAKVSGSYESVVRGVSEQVPQDRRSGQHHEQVNMISDPVRGLARRHGSIMQDETILGAYDENSYRDMLADTLRHKVVSFFVAGVEYDLIVRTQPDVESIGQTSFAWAFNKDTHRFIPIVYADTDPVLTALVSGGVSAATSIGRFLYLAGNTIVPSYVSTNLHALNRDKAAVWCRGGAYSRTFKITLTKADGTKIVGSYKTVSSSYPELLDTSDLLTSDPDYQKKVNDRVHAYNSAATKWIGTAAEDITPENIATKLGEQLTSAGVLGVEIVDSTVVIEDPAFVETDADDGGDGSLLRAVGHEVESAELVSVVHWAGKVVKIRPKRSNGDDAFYLEAVPKTDGATGWTEVSWRESVGYRMQPVEVFAMATVKDGSLYIASGATSLAAATGQVVPGYEANGVGDDITCPLPHMFGKRIDYLGVFQDRLVIGSGAVLLFSRPGDYLNWFRRSVLTVIDTDPVEQFALGAEDDTIRGSATYDRNLIFFGERFWYSVSGRQPLTPSSNGVVILRKEEDAIDAVPQTSGNFVFYGLKRGVEGKQVTSMNQVQAGLLADSPESSGISQQLDRYVQGVAVEIIALTAPHMILLRTDADRATIYTYAYLDTNSGSERLFDSWSRWTWDAALGDLVGMSKDGSAIMGYFLRHGTDVTGKPKTWIAAERFPLDTVLSDYPYADSLRPLPLYTTPAADAFLNPLNAVEAGCVSFANDHPRAFIGVPLSELTTFQTDYADNLLAWIGIAYPAFVTPTNPFALDRNGKAIVSGRLTLGRVAVSVADTGGMAIEVETSSGTKLSTDFNGRILGSVDNTVGYQPIVTTAVSGVVGREVRECSYTLKAKTWLPLTITAIEWTGQLFTNTRRV